eukprot:c4433_g1_i1.p1 GENE.c4433_g1_i1~~c4433_g1_i1.p1  ORF type:complete len:210 (+),score=66.56 c4433_g1_i1:28-630(+)
MKSTTPNPQGQQCAPPGVSHMYGGRSAGFYAQCPPLPPKEKLPIASTQFVVTKEWVDPGEKTPREEQIESLKKNIGWVGNQDPFWEGEERYNIHVSRVGRGQLTAALAKQDKEAIVTTIKAFGEDSLRSQVNVLEEERKAKADAQRRAQELAQELEQAIQDLERKIENRGEDMKLLEDAKPVQEISVFGMKTNVMERKQK